MDFSVIVMTHDIHPIKCTIICIECSTKYNFEMNMVDVQNKVIKLVLSITTPLRHKLIQLIYYLVLLLDL